MTPKLGPDLAGETPFANHERHFRPVNRAFDRRIGFESPISPDFLHPGHTLPSIISVFPSFRPLPVIIVSVNEPQDFLEQVTGHGDLR